MTHPMLPTDVRRTTVTALAVVIGVLAAAAGLFVVLFLMERADIRQLDTQLTGVERDLGAETDRLAASMSTVDDLDRARTDLETAITGLRVCADPAKASVDAAHTGDDEGLRTALGKMIARCGR